jgi:hypothetical protein
MSDVRGAPAMRTGGYIHIDSECPRRCAMTIRTLLARRWVAAAVIAVLAAVTFAVPAWCVASGTWGW